MATTEYAEPGEVHPAPPPRTDLPPPAAARPVVSPDGTVRRAAVPRRPPIARGTYALGAGAIGGTLLMIIGAGAGAVAVIATAAGTVLVPLAVWARRHRNRAGSRTRRGTTQRSRRTRTARSGGLSAWLPGGGGGGGRRVRGAGLGAAAGRGRAAGRQAGLGRALSGARSGGLTGGAGRAGNGRSAAGRVAGRGVPGTGHAGKGRTAGATRTPRGAAVGTGRGAITGGGRGRVWSPRGTKTAGGGTGKGAAVGKSGPRLGSGKAGWKASAGGGKPAAAGTGKGHGVGAGKAGGKGYGAGSGSGKGQQMKGPGKKGQRGGVYGTWNPNRHKRRLTRAGARVNGAGYRWAGALTKGAKQQTAGQAFKRAWKRTGRTGHNPTVSGYFGRVTRGLAAAVPAWVARAAWNTAKRVGQAIKKTYTKPAPPTTNTPAPVTAAPGTTTPVASPVALGTPRPPAPSRQHPVPPPAFAPNPAPAPATPAGAPTPTRVGAGAGTSTGGNPVTTLFPPYNAAADFYGACLKWTPGSDSGSVENLKLALPRMRDAIYLLTNGYAKVIANCEQDLQGGLEPQMRGALGEVWQPLHAAALAAGKLEAAYHQAYASREALKNVRGGHTANV